MGESTSVEFERVVAATADEAAPEVKQALQAVFSAVMKCKQNYFWSHMIIVDDESIKFVFVFWFCKCHW